MSSSSFSGVSVSQKRHGDLHRRRLPGELFGLDAVAGLKGGPPVADQLPTRFHVVAHHRVGRAGPFDGRRGRRLIIGLCLGEPHASDHRADAQAERHALPKSLRFC